MEAMEAGKVVSPPRRKRPGGVGRIAPQREVPAAAEPFCTPATYCVFVLLLLFGVRGHSAEREATVSSSNHGAKRLMIEG